MQKLDDTLRRVWRKKEACKRRDPIKDINHKYIVYLKNEKTIIAICNRILYIRHNRTYSISRIL